MVQFLWILPLMIKRNFYEPVVRASLFSHAVCVPAATSLFLVTVSTKSSHTKACMNDIKCPHNGCSFSTHSEKGIKIHMTRIHHKLCSITATCSVSSTMVANGMQISCSVQGCSFTLTSTKDIKIHLRKSHSNNNNNKSPGLCGSPGS